jgi:hypothetical protein
MRTGISSVPCSAACTSLAQFTASSARAMKAQERAVADLADHAAIEFRQQRSQQRAMVGERTHRARLVATHDRGKLTGRTTGRRIGEIAKPASVWSTSHDRTRRYYSGYSGAGLPAGPIFRFLSGFQCLESAGVCDSRLFAATTNWQPMPARSLRSAGKAIIRVGDSGVSGSSNR